jgi:hypothetical protein
MQAETGKWVQRLRILMQAGANPRSEEALISPSSTAGIWTAGGSTSATASTPS